MLSPQTVRHFTLIRPPTITGLNTYSSPATLSIGVAYIAASIKANQFDVKTIDSIGEGLDTVSMDYENKVRAYGLSHEEIINRIPKNTNAIGLSCMFTIEWPNHRLLIQKIKKVFPHVPIILGGEHVTSSCDNILATTPEVDICVLGEGEETIVELLKSNFVFLENIKGIAYRDSNQVVRQNERRNRIKQIEDIPQPDWSDFPLENYFNNLGTWCPNIDSGRHIAVLATRGCPYQCAFCSNPGMWTTRFIARSPQHLLEEIKGHVEKYKITGFDMSDLTAILNRDWIFEFTDLLIKSNLNLNWTLPQGTRTEQFDRELIKQLKKANLRFTSYCPETGSEKTCKLINKKVNLKKMLQSMKIAKEEGLTVKTDFIIGFPFERRWDVYQTIFYQFKCALVGVDDSIIHFYCPYPGSKIFKELYADGKITLDAEYYRSLGNMADLTNLKNYNEHMNKYELGFYRIFGMSLFYLTTYLTRPFRIFRSIKVFSDLTSPVTLFELRILEMLRIKKIASKVSN